MPSSSDALPLARKPHPGNRINEALTLFELPGLLLSTPSLMTAPRGRGREVVLLPGFMASGISMTPLALYLRWLGYRVSDWSLGVNRGQVDALTLALGQRLQSRAATAPITLIGWSLGGVIAREVARLYPSSIDEVITFGTPVVGGPKYTAVGARYARQENLDLDLFEWEVHRRNLIGLRQPLTVMYSKGDGVVGWEAAIDSYNAHARNIEVRGSHLGLGTNPQVWLEIARTLSR